MRKKNHNDTIETGDDADTMRKRIIRKLNDAQGYALSCTDKSCRRARRCVGEHLIFLRDNPCPKISEAEGARRLANFRKAVQQRIAELEAE
jgi:hypothetical protein